MEHFLQKTIQDSMSFKGKGMHSGIQSVVHCYPAELNSGILFERIDEHPQKNTVVPKIDSVVPYPACTCIANEQGTSILTIEHLLAACYATGIDNLHIKIEGPEVPILDGSAEPIVQLIESVGTKSLQAQRKIIHIEKNVSFEDEHRRFSFYPSDAFEVDINIYPQEYGHLRWSGDMTSALFRKEIVSAKAWGRLKDIWLPKLVGRFLKRPVLRGAGPDTAVLYAFGRPMNPCALLRPDDMVRHKVLDIIGDLQLLGAGLQGKIVCHSSAHATNHAAMRALMKNREAWRLVEV